MGCVYRYDAIMRGNLRLTVRWVSVVVRRIRECNVQTEIIRPQEAYFVRYILPLSAEQLLGCHRPTTIRYESNQFDRTLQIGLIRIYRIDSIRSKTKPKPNQTKRDPSINQTNSIGASDRIESNWLTPKSFRFVSKPCLVRALPFLEVLAMCREFLG